jgi:hypothetical protein
MPFVDLNIEYQSNTVGVRPNRFFRKLHFYLLAGSSYTIDFNLRSNL